MHYEKSAHIQYNQSLCLDLGGSVCQLSYGGNKSLYLIRDSMRIDYIGFLRKKTQKV